MHVHMYPKERKLTWRIICVSILRRPKVIMVCSLTLRFISVNFYSPFLFLSAGHESVADLSHLKHIVHFVRLILSREEHVTYEAQKKKLHSLIEGVNLKYMNLRRGASRSTNTKPHCQISLLQKKKKTYLTLGVRSTHLLLVTLNRITEWSESP